LEQVDANDKDKAGSSDSDDSSDDAPPIANKGHVSKQSNSKRINSSKAVAVYVPNKRVKIKQV
jgi:hypothetical protein